MEAASDKDDHDLGFDKLGVDDRTRRLANALVQIHGAGLLLRKNNGEIELRLADPNLLVSDGDKELMSRHLYVNLTKVIEDGHTKAARCVKNGVLYNINSLLQMLPLEARMPDIPKSKIKRSISAVDYSKYFEEDEHGNLMPPGPGEVIPIDQLPEGHPALEYVHSRGLDVGTLRNMFGACYCTKENPKVPYQRLPGGFSGTPQGRLIFYIQQLGAVRGWQGRRLERMQDGQLQFWHPYRECWTTVATPSSEPGKWDILPEFRGETIGKNYSALLHNKYVIGLGVTKQNLLMGFDAALAFNENRPAGERVLGVVEGATDAGKFGPPFTAVLGLTMLPNQASLVRNFFDKILVVPDNFDSKQNSGKFLESVRECLEGTTIKVVPVFLPEQVKDAGDMSSHDAKALIEPYLTNDY